jgi:hypothetical protein
MAKYTIDHTEKPRYDRHNTKMAINSIGMDKSIAETPEHYKLLEQNKAKFIEITKKEDAIHARYERMLSKQPPQTKQELVLMSDGRGNDIFVSLKDVAGKPRTPLSLQEDANKQFNNLTGLETKFQGVGKVVDVTRVDKPVIEKSMSVTPKHTQSLTRSAKR